MGKKPAKAASRKKKDEYEAFEEVRDSEAEEVDEEIDEDAYDFDQGESIEDEEGDDGQEEGDGEFDEDGDGEDDEDGDQEGDMDEEDADDGDAGSDDGDGEDGEDAELEGSVGEYDDGEDGEDEEETKALKEKLKAKKGKQTGPQKATLEQKRKKILSMKVSQVQCKERRLKLLDKRKAAIQTIENKRRREMRKQNKLHPELIMKPVTIEDSRIVTKSFLFNFEEEVEADENCDEFARLFNQEIQPKVLITTDENPSRHIFEYIKELKELIPNSYFYPRKKFPLQTICRLSTEKDFTHIIVVRERMKQPYQMIMICLPIGPSIVFRLSSVKLRKELAMHGAPTGHKPELILKNFNTSNGRRVGRFLGSMFDQDPEFRARTVVSFLNCRDFIFVRHHRYVFKENGTKCGLQEIGPRFTLKVKRIMEGTFEKHARVEWNARDDMYDSRKKVYL